MNTQDMKNIVIEVERRYSESISEEVINNILEDIKVTKHDDNTFLATGGLGVTALYTKIDNEWSISWSNG